MSELKTHWDSAYERGQTGVSWHQKEATLSLELITGAASGLDAPIVDIGGGASTLVDGLLDLGYTDLTVLDVSSAALQSAQDRLGSRADAVNWVVADILSWRPDRQFAVWHDRAVLHFLTSDEDARKYRETIDRALDERGAAVIGVFAENGPTSCSGLEVRRYAIGELESLLGSSFTTVSSRAEDHTTPSGNIQHFNWLVAQRLSGAGP